MENRKLSVFLAGERRQGILESPQKMAYQFDDLIFNKNKPTKSKKLKGINQVQFLNSPNLVKKYGFWRDTDHDKYSNFADSYPFDSQQHGFFSDAVKKIKKIISPKPQKPQLGSPIFKSTEKAGGVDVSKSPTASIPSGGLSSGGGGGGSSSPRVPNALRSSGGGSSGGGGRDSVNTVYQGPIVLGTNVPSSTLTPEQRAIQTYNTNQQRILSNIQSGKLNYNPYSQTINTYSLTGRRGTLYMQPATPYIRDFINQKQYEGDLYGAAVTGVPAQMTGGIFTTPTTESQREKIKGVKFFNPKNQFEVFKENYNYKKDLKEANTISDNLDKLNQQYTNGEIEYDKYANKFEQLSSNKAYQNVVNSSPRKDIFQRTSESNLSQNKKTAINIGVGLVDFVTFAVPPVRVIRGADYVSTGISSYNQATTPGERVGAGIQTGVGGLLVASGFSRGASIFGNLGKIPGKTAQGLANMETKAGISGGIGQRLIKFYSSKTGKVLKYGGKEVTSLGIAGIYGAGVTKETGDVRTGIEAGVGAYAGIKIPGAIEKFVKDKPLTIQESNKLKEDLNNLKNQEIVYKTDIQKGKGKDGSDKFVTIGTQETPNFKRKIIVKGDVIKKNGGEYLLPEGEGTSKIVGKFKVPNQQEKIFTNVQSIQVGAKGKGILLGKIGRVNIGTTIGSSSVVPRYSESQVIRNPRNFFENVRERVRLFVKKPLRTYGGQPQKEININTKPTILSMETNYPVNKDVVLSGFGISKGRNSRGTFFEFKDVEKPKINSFKGGGKKTPFSKTFGIKEPVKNSIDLISPKLNSVKENVKSGGGNLNERELPLMVGGKGLKTIPYEGQGTYDLNTFSEGVMGNLRDINVKGITGFKYNEGAVSRFSFGGASLSLNKKKLSFQKKNNLLLNNQSPLSNDNINTNTNTGEKTKEGTSLIDPSKQISSQGQINPEPPTFFYGEPPNPQPEPGFGIPGLPLIPKKKHKDEQAYDAYYLVQGTKKPKYEKVEGGVTLKSALGAMSRYVDKTISARGKVIKTPPIKKKVNGKNVVFNPKAKDTGDNYWTNNRYKFRNYATKKKKPLPTGVVIERQRFRLDSPGELRQISASNRRTPFGF